MSQGEEVASYRQLVESRGLRGGPFLFYLKRLFEDVPLVGRTLLDIGGGVGLMSFYAAAMGAREVVLLEPESAGAPGNTQREFESIQVRLGLEQVSFCPVTLQDFEAEGRAWDVILLHNSINHLDEPLTSRIQHDAAARTAYLELLRSISRLAHDGTELIVTDATNHNLWPKLGRRNPFARSIEWSKHQSPEVWAGLLSEVGFGGPKVNWPPFARLGWLGRLILDNRLAGFMLRGHFRLVMTKVG